MINLEWSKRSNKYNLKKEKSPRDGLKQNEREKSKKEEKYHRVKRDYPDYLKADNFSYDFSVTDESEKFEDKNKNRYRERSISSEKESEDYMRKKLKKE